MLRTSMLVCAVCLVSSGPLSASEMIHAERMTETQVQETVKAAPDDAVIEIRGQSKTKAQWRSDWQAAHKPPDPARLKAFADERQAKFEAAAKALKDEQASRIAKENAKVEAEFEALKAR